MAEYGANLRFHPGWRLVPLAAIGLLCGCANDTMWDDSRLKPLEGSETFADHTSSRPLPPDTVARGQAHTDTALYEGRERAPGRPLVTTFPFPITQQVLDRGEDRYNIYCSPCHGRTGAGNGMIVQRGFSPPPSYYIPRLRAAPVGHFYDVITNGYGVMYSYNDRVRPNDRWAIVAYIRALQATQPEAATAEAKPQGVPERALAAGARP